MDKMDNIHRERNKEVLKAAETSDALNTKEKQESALAKALGLDNFDIDKFNPTKKNISYDILKIAEKLNNLNPKQESLSDLEACAEFANRLYILQIDQDRGLGIRTKIVEHLATLEPNKENAKVYMQIVSVWGKHINCPQIKPWLLNDAGEKELESVFKGFAVDKVANASLDLIKATQPAGWAAHVLYKSKFAVDFLIDANETINSPVEGVVSEVHESPYDLNVELMNYIEECRTKNDPLNESEIREKMLIANEQVAHNTLELAQDYLQSGAHSMQEYFSIHKPGFQRADGVSIQDKDGHIHTILHAQPSVQVGDEVQIGEPIAKIEYNSGMANALHIHYEANEPGGRNIPIRNNTSGGASLYADNLPGLDRYIEFLGGSEA